MPAGTSWPRYISAVTATLLSMLAGSQVVHLMYRPLQDLEANIEREKIKISEARAQAVSAATADAPSSSSPAQSGS